MIDGMCNYNNRSRFFCNLSTSHLDSSKLYKAITQNTKISQHFVEICERLRCIRCTFTFNLASLVQQNCGHASDKQLVYWQQPVLSNRELFFSFSSFSSSFFSTLRLEYFHSWLHILLCRAARNGDSLIVDAMIHQSQ